MKPLAVLAIVAVAITGLFLAMTMLGEGPSTPEALEIDAPPAPGGSDTPAKDLAAAAANEREIAEVAPTDSGSARVDTAAEAGVHWNNSLFGEVMNTKQVLLPGAMVTLTRASAAASIFSNEQVDRSKDVTVQADENGKYRFVNIEPWDYYVIEATAEGYSRAEIDGISVTESGDFEAPPIQLTLGATLVGTVRDEGGNAVPEAKLILSNQFYRPGMELTPDMFITTSDSSGYFEISSIPAGNRTLTIEADGYGNMSFGGLVFRNTEPVERNVVLMVAEMISGRVIGKSGENIEGAEVMAMSYTNSSRACRDVAFTDADGLFTLDSLSPGQYTIAVRAVGYRPGNESRVKTGASGLNIMLSPQATISGHVLANGQPVPKYEVRLRQTYPNNPATSAIGKAQAFENADGSFLIDSVQPNTYVVQATAPGYAPSYSEEFRVNAGMPMRGVTVNLKRGGALTGSVVNKDGKAIPKPRVSTHDNTWADTIFDQALGDQFPTNATSRKATGESNGNFRVGGLKGETYQVRIKAAGYCDLILQDILVRDGQDTDLGEVMMMKGGTVSGQVVDSTGKPLAGAEVHLRPDGRRDGLPRSYNVRTNAKGRYRINGIFPGAYQLSTARGGGSNDFLGALSHEQNTTQKLTIGDEQKMKYDLKVNN